MPLFSLQDTEHTDEEEEGNEEEDGKDEDGEEGERKVFCIPLESLGLGGNKISDAGAVHLAEGLGSNTSEPITEIFVPLQNITSIIFYRNELINITTIVMFGPNKPGVRVWEQVLDTRLSEYCEHCACRTPQAALC